MKLNPRDYKKYDVLKIDVFDYKNLIVIVDKGEEIDKPFVQIPYKGSYYLAGDWDSLHKITKLVKPGILEKLKHRYV